MEQVRTSEVGHKQIEKTTDAKVKSGSKGEGRKITSAINHIVVLSKLCMLPKNLK